VKGLWLLALLFLAGAADAALEAPRTDSLESKLLGEKRDIEVYVPQEASSDPKARFETLYVLDGDWNAKLVAGTVDFMRQVGFLPPLIVVSIKHHIDASGRNTRDRDLTPTRIESEPDTGGAPQFLQFLTQELVPYVEAHYPCNGVKSIHGHSYGGLFLFYVLMNDPGAFDGYLILDPSLWWDHHGYDALIKSRLPALPVRGKAIFMAGRAGAAAQSMGLSSVEPMFRELAPPKLHWSSLQYHQETHDSLKLKGTYDGLKFLFGGYTQEPMDFAPSGGTIIKGKPLPVYMHNLSDRFDLRYTTDGSTPNEDSAKFTDHIVIDDAAARIRLLSVRGDFDRELPLNFKNGAALQPAGASLKADSNWQFRAYAASAWPKLARAHPFDSQSAPDIRHLKPLDRDDFAASAERRLAVATDDYYLFYLHVSADARVVVAGRPLAIVGEKNPHEQSLVMPLKRGSYPVRFEYLHPDKSAHVFFKVFRLRADGSEWWKEEPVLDLTADGF
jgi:predicted alpha/beta superfamily hydrolase